MSKAAIISPCGTYRYELYRWWGVVPRRWVLWVMLNPSTADAEIDDATIRRCIGFSRAWGYDGLMVGNLFAYRSTDPKALRGVPDPVGPDNRNHLRSMLSQASGIVCAWGDVKVFTPSMIESILIGGGLNNNECAAQCLGKTKGGYPRHPVRLAASTPLEPFQLPAT